jgi:hypothetical protein
MGHSGLNYGFTLSQGAIYDKDHVNAESTSHKIKTFREMGIKVLDHIGNIGEEMRELLNTFNSQAQK